ncbi:hypothetical protein PINS_up005193 [Pythium insidiosum]|nr:hypothetical protein PINS_up005193 [Pythium insidiosum]
MDDDGGDDNDDAGRPSRRSSRRKSDHSEEPQPLQQRRASPRALHDAAIDGSALAQTLLQATADDDFDDVLAVAYPELVE